MTRLNTSRMRTARTFQSATTLTNTVVPVLSNSNFWNQPWLTTNQTPPRLTGNLDPRVHTQANTSHLQISIKCSVEQKTHKPAGKIKWFTVKTQRLVKLRSTRWEILSRSKFWDWQENQLSCPPQWLLLRICTRTNFCRNSWKLTWMSPKSMK